MSVTLTISGNSSLLETHFQPSLNIENNNNCECGLLYFSALNSIPNINGKNNVFAYGSNQLKIPSGTYDLYDILDFLENNVTDCEIKIKPNNNTLKCHLYCSKTVHFDTMNSIGQLLGFANVKLEPNKWHVSERAVNILPVSVVRIECDLVQGSYINGSTSHIIHEFVPNVPPGHRYIEIPKNIIYLPVNKGNISSITVKIVDENGNYIDFGEETIYLRLHLRLRT